MNLQIDSRFGHLSLSPLDLCLKQPQKPANIYTREHIPTSKPFPSHNSPTFSAYRWISFFFFIALLTGWAFAKRQTALERLQPAATASNIRQSAVHFASFQRRIEPIHGHDWETGIGEVLGMAAVIGKCMLEMIAADRIVQWMLGLLRAKLASHAFMG